MASWRSGLLVFALCGALYACFLPRLYTADDLQYASTIHTAVTGEPVYHPVGGTPFPAARGRPNVPVNPRYVLDWPTSVAAVRVARSLGWRDEIDSILLTRIVMGAAGVTFLFGTMLLIAGRLLPALIPTVALATSLVYWTYSSHLDESIAMVAFTCAAVFFLVRSIVRGPSRADLLVPLVLGAGALYNLGTAVTALPAALVWGRRQVRSLALFAGVYLGAAAIGIVGALAADGGGSKMWSSAYWRSSLFVGRPEYGFRPFHDAFEASASFLRALVAYPPVQGFETLRGYFDAASSVPRVAALAYYGVVALFALAPLALLLRQRPRDERVRRLRLFGVAWFLTAAAFGWWWDPTYVKYFLLVVVSWSFVLGLALRDAHAERRILAVASVAVAASFALNLATIFLPQRSRSANEWLAASHALRRAPASALFVSAGRHPLDFYIAYFADRDVVSAGLVRYANGDEAAVTRTVSRRVRAHLAADGPIYVYGLADVTAAERRRLLRVLPRGPLRRTWTFAGLPVYRR